MAKRRFNRYWFKVGLTGIGAVAAIAGASALVKPPPLTPVAVLAHPVAAMGRVPSKDIRWVRMEHPPTGTITRWTGTPLAAHALTTGTVLTVSDFTSTAQATGLKPNEVRYVVSITAASAVTTVGNRVDLWSLPASGSSGTSGPQELAIGVRVIGLYSSQGMPAGGSATSGGLLNGSSSTPQAPAMAALAVPADALPSIMSSNPGQTVLLVTDPSQSQFALMTPTSGSSMTPSGSTTTTTPSSGTTTTTTPSSHTTTPTSKSATKSSSKP